MAKGKKRMCVLPPPNDTDYYKVSKNFVDMVNCIRKGYTTEQIADKYGVNEACILQYMEKYSEYFDMNIYRLYTDGGCWPNPGGQGGWAFILKNKSGELVFRQSGCSDGGTTNNRMELHAVIEGLQAGTGVSKIDLYSDSQYVVNGINEWMFNWEKKGWKNIANVDLWKKVAKLVSRNNVIAHWVQGHNGHPENEECDQMAFDAYRAGKA